MGKPWKLQIAPTNKTKSSVLRDQMIEKVSQLNEVIKWHQENKKKRLGGNPFEALSTNQKPSYKQNVSSRDNRDREREGVLFDIYSRRRRGNCATHKDQREVNILPFCYLFMRCKFLKKFTHLTLCTATYGSHHGRGSWVFQQSETANYQGKGRIIQVQGSIEGKQI